MSILMVLSWPVERTWLNNFFCATLLGTGNGRQLCQSIGLRTTWREVVVNGLRSLLNKERCNF